MTADLSVFPSVCSTTEEKSLSEYPGQHSPQSLLSKKISEQQGKIYVYKIEESLKSKGILSAIESEKANLLSLRKITCPTLKELCKEAKNHCLKMAGKVAACIGAAAATHPFVLSAIACFNTYRVGNWDDLYSSDEVVANEATQLYGNLGHGPGYFVHAGELLLAASAIMLYSPYKKAVANTLQNIYSKHMNDPSLTKEEKEFIYNMKRDELNQWGISPSFESSNQMQNTAGDHV